MKKMIVAFILFSCSLALGYEDQKEDEQIIQEAIEEGIIDSHPFPPVGDWGDWVNNCGDMLSYRSLAISHWEEVAEATDMTAEQRAEAEALHEQFREAHEAFDETTTAPKNKLKARSEEAKKAGKDELAGKLKKLVHVQAHYKLAIQGGASEALLRLLRPEQLKEWHTYRVTKHGRDKMRHWAYKRSINGEDLEDVLNLTGEQKRRINEKAWEISQEYFLPTVKNPEDVSAFGVYGEQGKRAQRMGDEKLTPWMVENVLTEMQRAKLAFPNQRWYTSVSPSGGVYRDGEKLMAEASFHTDGGDKKGVQIRYTLDSSTPSPDSKLYKKPQSITRDTTFRAQCFRDGQLLPGNTASAQFTFLSGSGEAKPGLNYQIYRGLWSRLPQFRELEAAKRGVAPGFNLGVTEQNENFGLVFSGYLNVPKAGEYTFFTTSDDGSALYIDDKLIVDNDGVHGPQEKNGKVSLTSGYHLIRVEYFDAGGGKGLQVHWSGPGIDKQSIPARQLSHKPADASEVSGDTVSPYRVHTGKWFVMRDGKFALTDERPDLPDDELRWRAWAAAHRINKGPYWPYQAVRDHGKILENIDATPEQKRIIEEIVAIARDGDETYDKETKPRHRELKALEEKAKEAGETDKAATYHKRRYMQVDGKLALQRAPFFEILTLLTDEQWDSLIDAIPKYQKLRDGMDAMKQALEQTSK